MKLSNGNIETSLDNLESALSNLGVDRKDILRTKLMLEEIMLTYQDNFGNETEFVFSVKKKVGRLQIVFTFDAPRLNPLEKSDGDSLMQSLLSAQGLAPFWNYQNGQNSVTYILKKKKKHSSLFSLLISLAAAVALGMLCRLLPGNILSVLSGQIIGPLFDTFMRAITCIAGPLIFLSVVWGIYNIGDISTVEIIGRRMFGRFMLMLTVLSALSLVLVMPMFTVASGTSGKLDIYTFYQMILDIIPNNIISPFSSGNTLQIIYLAICFGLAVLILGKKALLVTQFTAQANYIIQLIMDFISGLVNVFVFMSIFNMIVGDSFKNLRGIYKFLPVMLIGCTVSMLIYLFRVSAFKKVSPITLLKKMIPTFLIAISTASSAAAFIENFECCTKKLGISEKIANFGLPVGQIVFPIGSAMSFISIGLCVAEIDGIQITPKWLLTMFLISIILAIATPPIPGGSIACFTVFAAQLGFANEMVSLCITISIITDFIATATNLFCLQLELTGLSGNLGMLDDNILRNKC